MAPASANDRRAANGRAFTADRRHPRKATARVVNTTTMRVTKKVRGLRATRVKAMRVIMETSPREEGDDGHNNQLGTKAAATARAVVATAARAMATVARVMATGKKGDGNDGNDSNYGNNGNEGNNCNDDAKRQR